MGVGGGWWEVGVLVLYPVHLCIHNCNTRACALLGVSLQCHLDLLQVAGQQPGEKEKFKQFHWAISVSQYISISALLIRFYYLHQSQQKNVCQFQFKIFNIMSEMSGVSFLISSPHRGFWPALYVRELKKMWSRLVFVLFYSFNIVNIIEISSQDSVRRWILFILPRTFLRM